MKRLTPTRGRYKNTKYQGTLGHRKSIGFAGRPQPSAQSESHLFSMEEPSKGSLHSSNHDFKKWLLLLCLLSALAIPLFAGFSGLSADILSGLVTFFAIGSIIFGVFYLVNIITSD